MSEVKNEQREWYVFDASEKTLGRLASDIANTLRGKSKVSFRNNQDSGDYAVVLNAAKLVLTGNKINQVNYYKHTGYLGNLKTKSIKELLETAPEEVVKHAVRGMLPKNKLSDGFMSRLKVYAGSKHPHVNVKFKNKD